MKTLQDVMTAYSGRPGCMCGCKGKYSVASEWQVAAGVSRGYAVSPEDVSDVRVKNIWNTIMKNAVTAEVDADGMYFRTETRMYAVWFAPSLEELDQKVKDRAQRETEYLAREKARLEAELVGAGI